MYRDVLVRTGGPPSHAMNWTADIEAPAAFRVLVTAGERLVLRVTPAPGAPGYVVDMGEVGAPEPAPGSARGLTLMIEGSDPPSVITAIVRPTASDAP